jgi:hypothetical protein
MEKHHSNIDNRADEKQFEALSNITTG